MEEDRDGSERAQRCKQYRWCSREREMSGGDNEMSVVEKWCVRREQRQPQVAGCAVLREESAPAWREARSRAP